jgi:hypothetical protein
MANGGRFLTAGGGGSARPESQAGTQPTGFFPGSSCCRQRYAAMEYRTDRVAAYGCSRHQGPKHRDGLRPGAVAVPGRSI